METDITKGSNQIAPAAQDMFFDDVQSRPGAPAKASFDFVLWFYRILKYWYLFVISFVVCLGYAYVQNEAWVPLYNTRALLVLEPRGDVGVTAANNNNTLLRNRVNQQMILTSYDMLVRTVNGLPKMRISYFRDGKFNQENLHGRTPVVIEWQYIGKDAYADVYRIEPINSEKCRIVTINRDKKDTSKPESSVEVAYGQFYQDLNNKFYIRINKSPIFLDNATFQPFNFRFVSKDELVNRYSGTVSAITQIEGSSALTVQKTGTNPAEDIEFMNSLLKEYNEYNLLLKNEAADRSIKFLEKQLNIMKDSLGIAESDFKDFQNETGVYESTISTTIRTGAAENSKDKFLLKDEEASLMEITALINQSILENEKLPVPTFYTNLSPNLIKNIEAYNTLVTNLARMGNAYPMYQTNVEQLKAMQYTILDELLNEQNVIQKRKDQLAQKDKEFESQIATLPTQEMAFLRYEKNFQMYERYVNRLTERIQGFNLQKASNIADNYILEAPRQAGGAINGAEKNETFMFYFALGLAIPLLFVIAKEELFNFTIATKEECERITGFPVIGAVENISKKLNKGRAIVKNFPKSSFAESFRNMRVRIEYMAQRESSIRVLVTSAEPADGKTFVAANIASIYQLTGRRVVLVDFDLRRPSVAKLLDIHSKRGVSNFLIGQVSLDEILITHPDYGFDVIPAGTLPPNPSELIKTRKTKDLIEYLHSKYDYVIIDCSPVGLVSDAYILAKLVDTTLFVVRRAKTNKSFFKSVVNQLKMDGIYNVGLVFNDVKGREGYYGTSRYYGDKAYYLRRNSYYHDDYFEK